MFSLAVFTFLCVSFLGYRLRKRDSRLSHLPPGPPPDPIIGHLRILSNEKQEETLYELSKTYGDVIYLHTLGQKYLILNSEKASEELLGKQGLSYRSRPPFYFFHNIGWDDVLVLLPYGQRFLRNRKIIQQAFTVQKVAEYRHIEEREINVLLKKLLDRPAEYVKHIHLMAASIIMDITYGHRIISEDDKHLDIVRGITDILGEGRRVSIMDLFPVLQYAPEWIQTWFVPSIKETQHFVKEMKNYPLEMIHKEQAKGSVTSSMVSKYLDAFDINSPQNSEEYDDIRGAGHVVIAGGAETTWSTLLVFFACMTLYPEAQRRAQEEIDRVIGNGRTPEFEDRESLPYVHALVLETMRWHPVLSTGIPHYSTSDGEYRGMFIPKGTTVITNLKGISRDESVYKDADMFKPERFLPEGGETFNSNVVFGYGRRKCPGQYLADATIWLAIAKILALFNISKVKGEDGEETDTAFKFQGTGTVSYPEPVACDILPRHERLEGLIHNV